jgi:hypothetical protein
MQREGMGMVRSGRIDPAILQLFDAGEFCSRLLPQMKVGMDQQPQPKRLRVKRTRAEKATQKRR